MPSIVDPVEKRGGAWAVTSGLVRAMESAWPDCSVDVVASSSRGRVSHRVRQAGSVIASVVAGGLPAKMRFTRTRSVCRRIHASLQRRMPDLVVLNGSDVAWARSEIPPRIPVIVVAHNLEHRLYRRQIANLPDPFRMFSRILESDAKRLEELEMEVFRQARCTVFLSEEDRDSIEQAATIVMPPLFEYEPHPRSRVPGDRLRLGMFADFEWWPNRVGLDWFITNIWPGISDRCELHLLGYGSQHAASGSDGIFRHGFVNQARDAFAECDLMIAPITDGGGIKVKVAEALYNRVPVVATPGSVSRIFIEGNPALRICKDAREWIDFLTGPDARLLASQAVPAAVRDAFTVERGAEALRNTLLFLKAGAYLHS